MATEVERDETAEDDTESNTRETWVLVGVGIFCLVLYGLNWLALLWPKEDRSSFGDMFGIVGAFFSGAAFFGVIYAILLQKRELVLQRKELALTREELEDTRKVFVAQNETFEQQKFDSAFFQMLALHHEIVKGMDVTSQGKPVTGRDCFMIFYEALKRKLETEKFVKMKPTGGWERPQIELAYSELYENYQSDIGHYFRNLYNIIKFVKRSKVPDQKFYTNLVRAQLSSNELLLLFYNCVSPPGREKDGTEKFKPLVEEFALLKNMPEHGLIRSEFKGWYSAGAYGSNA